MNIYESPISMSRHRHPNSGFCYIFSRPLIGTLCSRGRRCKRGSCTSRPPRSQNGSWSSPRWCPQKKKQKDGHPKQLKSAVSTSLQHHAIMQRGLMTWHDIKPSRRHQSSWECRMPLIPQFRRCTKRVWRPVRLIDCRFGNGSDGYRWHRHLGNSYAFHCVSIGQKHQCALEWWSKYIQMPWHHPSRPQISHRPRLNGKSPGALFPSALSCEGGNIRDKPWLAMKKGNYGKLRGWKI